MFNIYYIFFLSGALSSLYFLFFRKRNFDFISVFVLVLVLYTLPLFFGGVKNVYTGDFLKPEDQVYLVMGIPYFVSILFIVLNNSYNFNRRIDFLHEKIALNVLLLLSMIGIALYLPSVFASSSKVELLENKNLMVQILYANVPVVGFLLALLVKNKRFICIFLLCLSILFLFGSRRSIALALIGSLIIVFMDNPLRLVSKIKWILLGVGALVVVVLSKTMYGYVLARGVVDGLKGWFYEFEWRFLFTGSEFLTTSTILNSVILNDFKTDKLYYFYSFLALQPIPLSNFNYASSYFNDMFQPALFPGVTYGMAYNPWAEAYSVFGYWGVLFFSIFICLVLRGMWYICIGSNRVLLVILLFFGSLIAFWVERNSLATLFAYVRNVLYPLLIIYFITVFLRKVLIRR
ncbi:O-antigen polymerase [Acinetobacter haemolyticus]|uniref:O-antigen polymerase n=1 Tax=Acinetobacter haemolyticus TaxID=29430 RepID=UPI00325A7C24